MARRSFASLRGKIAVLALFAALGVALAIGASGSERLVQSGFDKALTMRVPSPVTAPGAVAALPQSEEFWLRNGYTRSAAVKPAAFSGTQLSRGDRITFAQGEAPPRVLEVMDTTPVALDATRLDDSPEGAQMLAVSCRDLSRPGTPTVRLIVSEGALPFSVTRPAVKAL